MRPLPIVRWRRQTGLGEALCDILEHGARLVDRHLAVAQRGHAIQRVDECESRESRRAGEDGVDRQILRAGL